MTKPLYEPTEQRQIRKLGFSSDQLFRRPAPPQEATPFPFAYATVTSFDAEDDTEYTLFAGDDGGYAGNALGVAENIYIGNDDANATFYLINPVSDQNQCIAIHQGQPGLYAYDAAVVFAGGFDGVIEIYPDTDFAIWDGVATYSSPNTWPMMEWRVLTSGDDHAGSVRISGVVYLHETGVDLSNMFSIIFTQRSGDTQLVIQAWAFVTKLSEAPATSVPSVYPL